LFWKGATQTIEPGRELGEFICTLAGPSVAARSSTLAKPSTVRPELNTGNDRLMTGGVRHFAITNNHNKYRQWALAWRSIQHATAASRNTTQT
jgi:hypothetical protein